MPDDTKKRFDTLLKAMLDGPAPSAGKKPSADQASGGEPPACYGDTQTPRDTSEDDGH